MEAAKAQNWAVEPQEKKYGGTCESQWPVSRPGHLTTD
jgi:hypothetical protein